MIQRNFIDQILFRCGRTSKRQFFFKQLSTSARSNFKVALLGATGGIGQPLGLMLMKDPLVSRLALYDVTEITPGVAEDLSHINTDVCVEGGFVGENDIGRALCEAAVVVIAAGKPREPGMSREELFTSNAKLIVNLCRATIKYCPKALLAIITNPINSMIPIVDVLKKKNGPSCSDKIFGVTTLDLVRASTFVAREYCKDPACVHVPVIGGHSGTTIVPLLSQCIPAIDISQKSREKLTKMIQDAGTMVVKAKAGAGSATLSTALATARLVNSLLRGISGETNVVDYAYVRSDLTQAPYFASPLLLGKGGIDCVCYYGCVNEYEEHLIENAVSQLQKNIKEGTDYVQHI